jgi:hypothetical protein
MSLAREAHSLHRYRYRYRGLGPQTLGRLKPQYRMFREMFRTVRYRRRAQVRILVRRRSPGPILFRGRPHPRRHVPCRHRRP